MKRIKAFTLVELTVVMLISGFLFGIAYLSLQILQKRFQQYTISSEALQQISQLEALLQQDFCQAQHIQRQGDKLLCRSDSMEVHYQFTEDYLLREQQTQVDTFFVSHEALTSYWLGQPKFEGLIDELSFQIHHHEEELPFHARKLYSAEQLMHFEESFKKP